MALLKCTGLSFAFLRAWVVRVVILLLIGVVLGSLANLFLPQRIAWVGDWGNHLEALAYAENFKLASIGTVREIVQAGTHLVIDARTYEDFLSGHIETALPLSPHDPDDPWNTRGVLSPEDALLIYCSGPACEDALLLGRQLRDGGLTNITLFIGGWEEWSRSREVSGE